MAKGSGTTPAERARGIGEERFVIIRHIGG